MYIGPKHFDGDIEMRHNAEDDCFYFRIGDFEAYFTRAEMAQIAARGAKALDESISRRATASIKNHKR